MNEEDIKVLSLLPVWIEQKASQSGYFSHRERETERQRERERQTERETEREREKRIKDTGLSTQRQCQVGYYYFSHFASILV